MPPDDFWSPPPRRRRADEPDPQTPPAPPPARAGGAPPDPRFGRAPQGPGPQHPQQYGAPQQAPRPEPPRPREAGPQSFPQGPQTYPQGHQSFPTAPGSQSYPQGPQSLGAAGPQSFPTGPVYPGSAPSFRASAPAPVTPPTYPPAPSYEPPSGYGDPTPYGQPAFAPPAPAGYPPYDSGTTQVFGHGLIGAEHHTGPVPVYDDDFARSATARIDFGPHEAFGPPPEEVEPEPEPDAAHVFDRLRRIRSHARTKRKRRGWVGVVVVLVLFAAAAALRFVPASPFYPKGDGEASPAAATVPFHHATVTAADLGVEGFLSWAYQDLRPGAGGALVGSANMAETTDATAMLAAWLGADLLSRAVEAGQDPDEAARADVEAMIRTDDGEATARVLTSLGGYTESIDRLRALCNLSDTEAVTGSWQETTISAEDAARMGACLADGRAAGAEWTPWLLNVMRQVEEPGDFGIPNAFPLEERAAIAIKNGMLLDEETGEWSANCLAIGDTWALAILQRFPATDDPAADLGHADTVCQQVVARLTG